MTKPTCSIDGCDSTNLMARGWCGAHYKRWYRHGDPLAAVNRRAPDGADLPTRLTYVGWTAVARRPDLTDCHEWDGLRDSAGYGRVWDGSAVAAAHRVAFTVWVGPIPDATHVLHLCDNPPCVNPAHLFLGDDTTNMADMVAKRRSDNGERRWSHKLTDADVANLRAAYTGARGEQAALAAVFGVTPGYVSVLVRGLRRTDTTHWEVIADDSHSVGRRG